MNRIPPELIALGVILVGFFILVGFLIIAIINKKMEKLKTREIEVQGVAGVEKQQLCATDLEMHLKINEIIDVINDDSGFNQEIDELLPVGYSQWIAHGKKYGYHDYWKEMTRIAMRKELEEGCTHEIVEKGSCNELGIDE